jgi:hypothetical protein
MATREDLLRVADHVATAANTRVYGLEQLLEDPALRPIDRIRIGNALEGIERARNIAYGGNDCPEDIKELRRKLGLE